MRINVGRGNGGSLNRYLLDERKRAKGFELESPIFCTNMVGSDVAELNAEFQLSADLRSDVKRTIAHYSISFPPGENPNLKTKQAIVKDLLQEMGHQDCQFFAVEHHDQSHKRGVHHLHVATSTINLEGNWVSDKFDRVRLKEVERSLELRHGLQYCPPREKGKRRNLTTGESRQEERTGEPCAKRKLWEVLDQAIADKPDLSTALLRVRVAGASVRFSQHEDGGKGLSFGLDGKHFPGKRLGDQYSFYGLQQYAGLDYQPNRDDPVLREIEHLTSQQCNERLQKQQQEQRKSDPQAWEVRLQLREWVRESLQRSPQHPQQSTSSEVQPQPIEQLITPQNYKDFLPQSAPQPAAEAEQVQQPEYQSAINPEFVRSMEELRQAFQHVLEQAAGEPELAETEHPLQGSIEWNRAEFVLNFAHATLEKKQKASAENSSYRLDRIELEITVTRKADEQIIAQGKLGAVGWDITVAEVEIADWMDFIKQQKNVNQERSQSSHRSRSQFPKQQNRDDGLDL
ncbi:relaxase/mobilization nuclease domain-containing protein [Leptolyngbya sp. GB1-A1]|uniref:relaxase/mobilization nuclease domain-containing protein n=1 Tax=Leptolyngbya sp. GB1-A1 TaxID=2933908 RepID=UPI0032986522